QHDQAQLKDEPRHLWRYEIENRSGRRGFILNVLGCVPDEARAVAREVHRQRGVARLLQTSIGHEVGAADRRDGPSLVPKTDQNAVITTGHRLAVAGLVRGAPPATAS